MFFRAVSMIGRVLVVGSGVLFIAAGLLVVWAVANGGSDVGTGLILAVFGLVVAAVVAFFVRAIGSDLHEWGRKWAAIESVNPDAQPDRLQELLRR